MRSFRIVTAIRSRCTSFSYVLLIGGDARYRGSKIKQCTHYIDIAGMMTQLGAMPGAVRA